AWHCVGSAHRPGRSAWRRRGDRRACGGRVDPRWLHAVRAGAFTLHFASRKSRQPAAHAAAGFPSGRLDRGFIGPYLCKPAIRLLNASGLDRPCQGRPGEISFAATGIGRITHLTGLLLQSKAGINLEAVPYAGGPAAALTDVIGGRVPLIIEGYSGLAGAIAAHSINVLAVTSAHRLPDFPDVPTGAENPPGVVSRGWQGIRAPPRTPPWPLKKINDGLRKVLSD